MSAKKAEFTQAQREAFLDLVLMAIYADGHLASAEEAGVERLLTALGWTEAYDRQQQLDAAITRIRPYTEVPEKGRAYAAVLAKRFTTRAQCLRVYGLLQELTSSDGSIAAAENQLLEVVRGIFRL